MKLNYTTTFRRSYKKLSEPDKLRIRNTVRLFREHPFDPRLRNHKLKGEQKNLRSLSAGFDLRIIYREERSHTIVFLLEVGSHEQVYK